jgi:hypothetical protein
MNNAKILRGDGEASTSVLRDIGTALKNDKVNTSVIERVRGDDANRPTTYDDNFETVFWHHLCVARVMKIMF